MEKILILAIFVMLNTSNLFGASIIKQKEKISFDAHNYLIFEDVGRVEMKEAGQEYTGFGKFLRLHVCRDGKQIDIDMIDKKYPPEDPAYQLVAPHVTLIKYMDKDNIWFVNESHALNWATLYNLAKEKIVKQYFGVHVQLSPDARKVATIAEFVRKSTGYKKEYVVFVNDMMVFPYVEPEFKLWDKFSPQVEDRIKKTDGVSLSDFMDSKIKIPNPQGRVYSKISWNGKGEISFHVKNKIRDTTATRIVVSGLEKDIPANIKVKKAGVDPMK
ncbi:hypothetical protein LLG95_03510 [bacterium]|nr:hypothetical protein [bacterium]